MKRLLPVFGLIIVVLFCWTNDLYGQRRRADQPVSSGGLKDRLWYGGGFNLGFSGGNDISLFQFGLSPMVGYKIMEPFSIGPRAAVTYSFYKARTFNGAIDRAQPLSWALGVFSRYKIVPTLFAHVEYEFENEAFVEIGIDELEVFRREQNNVYLGGGYTSGSGLVGYEIVLLYNVNEPANSIDLPWVIRFGFTYNF